MDKGEEKGKGKKRNEDQKREAQAALMVKGGDKGVPHPRKELKKGPDPGERGKKGHSNHVRKRGGRLLN